MSERNAEQDLVSIVIPVYKVEPYLRRCLDSALAQTYPNIEVIAVDDGSPDNCPAICDEYAARDPRVRVIHRENGGLSAARNSGIEAARGEWLYFMDSDDWCEPTIIEHCMEKVAEHDADMVIFDLISTGHRPDDGLVEVGMEAGLHTPYETLEALYNDRIDFGIWHFVFARRLFDRIRFPNGEICEDIAILYELIESTRAVYVLHEVGYHYLSRRDSLTKETGFRIVWWQLYQTARMLEYARQHRPELARAAMRRIGWWSGDYCKWAARYDKTEDIELLRGLIKEYDLRPDDLPTKRKVVWHLFCLSPKLLKYALIAKGKLGRLVGR